METEGHHGLKSTVFERDRAAQWNDVTPCYNGELVLELILSILAAIRVFVRSRGDTALEVLAFDSKASCSNANGPVPV